MLSDCVNNILDFVENTFISSKEDMIFLSWTNLIFKDFT